MPSDRRERAWCGKPAAIAPCTEGLVHEAGAQQSGYGSQHYSSIHTS
jgi:hypothetical protein